MKRFPRSMSCVALLAAAFLSLAVSQAQAATIHNQGSIQYVCGGVGEGSLQKMQAQAAKFNLGFWMVKGPQGEYLAQVPVKIMRDGKVVARFTAGGPLCYLKVPAGTYTIEGRHDGQLRTIQAHSGTKTHDLRW